MKSRDKIIRLKAKRTARNFFLLCGLDEPEEFRFEIESDFLQKMIDECSKLNSVADSEINIDCSADLKKQWILENVRKISEMGPHYWVAISGESIWSKISIHAFDESFLTIWERAPNHEFMLISNDLSCVLIFFTEEYQHQFYVRCSSSDPI